MNQHPAQGGQELYIKILKQNQMKRGIIIELGTAIEGGSMKMAILCYLNIDMVNKKDGLFRAYFPLGSLGVDYCILLVGRHR